MNDLEARIEELRKWATVTSDAWANAYYPLNRDTAAALLRGHDDLKELRVAITTVDASEFPPHIARDQALAQAYLDGRQYAAVIMGRILGASDATKEGM